MARAPTMVVQDDYIDMDLSPSSPKRALLEFEFHSSGAGAAVSNSRERRGEEAAYAAPADELFYRGKLLPLHLPPRLQLVQKLLQEQQARAPEIKPAAAAEPGVSASADAEDGKAGAKRYSWSRRLKLMKRWASREYIKSLFLAKAGDLGIPNGGGRERAGLLDQDDLCGHRRSFSGIIRRVRLVVATKAPAPGASPLCSSSSASSSSSSTPSCGNAERFFLRPRSAAAATMPVPMLKRSSSAGSEEGAIQGAIAHCKRSHQQLLLQQGRKSASGVVFYSVSNTPRISTSVAAAAANESSQERQEMCRG
ncbi:hypothetical protein ZWY2020_054295 [Hordeum vulgare]|nr:hypothetical protein ZWY2020_054295 [Hordeum vulgare]